LNDGNTENRWSSDHGTIVSGKPQHIVAIVDGPKIVTFVIDGKLCDGGEILRLRMYNRYLRTSEAVAAFRAGY